MDAQMKAKWVAALRSGEYKQTKGCLQDDKGFCCIGVLCDLSGMGRWQPEDDGRNRYRINQHVSPRATLPWPIADKYEIDGFHGELYTMNDSGKPFSEIADFIEANL